MNNDKGLLSGSITILIGAVIAIMALVRGPWQAWLLIGVFTLWGLWVVLILLLPYMVQAKRRRQRQQREHRLHAEGIGHNVEQKPFHIPELDLCLMNSFFATPIIGFLDICILYIRIPILNGVRNRPWI